MQANCTHRKHSERRVSQPRSAASAGNIEVAEHISESETSRRLWNQPPECLGRLPDFHGTLAFHPPEAPGPVDGFSCDTCLQPPNCWGRLPDFHGTLACHAPKRLGRFVDFHVTLAFSFQIPWAGFLIFMGPWPSTPRSSWAGLLVFMSHLPSASKLLGQAS